MAPIVRVFSVMFIIMSLVNIYPWPQLTGIAYIFSLFTRLFVIIIALYLFIFGYENLRSLIAKPNIISPFYLDYITLASSFTFITIIYFITGGAESVYKILFLPMILFYTIRFGLNWGLAASGLAAFTLTAANTVAFIQKTPLNLELDIIYIGIFFLTSWLVGSMVDMERAISDRLSVEVNRDDLTGLFNRRYLQEELKRKIGQEKKYPFALIFMGLDSFKHFNEAYGYQAGNRLLVEVADIVVKTVNDLGKVFRYGGDEFAVLVEDADRERALALAETLRRNIRQASAPPPDSYYKYDATVSLGVAFYPLDAATGEELLVKAGQALYKAREISGDKVEAYYSVLECLRAGIDGFEMNAFNKLDIFLAIINAKDRYTYGHSERVLIYASVIASLIGMPLPAKKNLQYGAYLHDIGKLEIDRTILNKPGKLDEDEWTVMQKHPLWGADIARQIRSLAPAVPAILFHHERFDGSGYPFELTGKEIPLEGRIMALADSFDAMTVERPYRKAQPYREAVREITVNRKTQFDPDIANVFIDFLLQYQSVDELLTPEIRTEYLL